VIRLPWTASGKDQLDFGGSGAATPVGEYTPPGNLTRHEDQFAIEHGTVRYRFHGRVSPELASPAAH
jgi:hypothetical protein